MLVDMDSDWYFWLSFDTKPFISPLPSPLTHVLLRTTFPTQISFKFIIISVVQCFRNYSYVYNERMLESFSWESQAASVAACMHKSQTNSSSYPLHHFFLKKSAVVPGDSCLAPEKPLDLFHTDSRCTLHIPSRNICALRQICKTKRQE